MSKKFMANWLGRVAAVFAVCTVCGCADSGTGTVGQAGPGAAAQDADDEHYIETLTPANDYYGYINAKDLMNMSIKPGNTSSGTLSIIGDETKERLKEIINDIANSNEQFPKGSHEQAIHDMYWLVYDRLTEVRDDDAEDTVFMDAIIDKIYSVENVNELFDMWHELRMDYGLQPFYVSGITPDLYDTDRTIMWFSYNTIADLEEIRESQVKAVHIRDDLAGQLRFLGLSTDEAKERAGNIILAYYEIAGSSDMGIINGDKEEYEYFNILSREECSGLLKHFTYEQLIGTFGLEGELPERVVVYDPEQMSAVDELMDEEHLQVWQDITFLQLIGAHTVMFPDKYRMADVSLEMPVDEMVFTVLNTYLNEAIADIYAEKYFTEEKRRSVQKMCDDIVLAYHSMINNAGWLSAEGKAYLSDKLDNIEFNIGWSGERIGLEEVFEEISDHTLLQAVFMIDRAVAMENIAKYGKPDKSSAFSVMPASTVNACYRPQHNDVVITAAILNPLVFDENAEYARNLGAIGAVIGHEISHGFDDKGVLYDAKGNFRPDAMPQADIDGFKKIQDKAVDYYGRFTVLNSHVNGKQTLGENLADISGLQCMLSIAGTKEEQKIVFENYARLWKTLVTDTSVKDQLDADPHSPAVIRVNAAVSCFDEYYDIYDVKEGDEMYVAPEDRIRRW